MFEPIRQVRAFFNNTAMIEATLSRKTVWFWWSLLALLILVSRLPTFNEAFERDLMTYMVIADGLLNGRSLYVDLFEFRPPGVFWTYALFAKVFGASPLAIFMMGLTCAWLTLWACYVAGRNMAGSLGGLLAAAIWTVISGDLLLQANQPNTEVFINAALAGAFALLVGATPDRKQIQRFIAIGLLYGLASLFKQISLAVTAVTLGTYVLLAPWMAEHQEAAQQDFWPVRVRALWQAVWAGLVVLLCWGLVIGYFQWLGHLSAFKEALVDTGRSYAGDIWGNVWGFFSNPLVYVPKSGNSFYVPLAWLLTVLAAGYYWRDRNGRLGLWLAYFGSSLITIALPGKFFPHYFQLWLPPLAIGAGCLLGHSLVVQRRLAVGLLLAVLLPLVGLRLYQHTIPVEQVPFYKYGQGHGPEAVESQRIGLWIAQHLDPNTSVYQWGAEPGVYFWAGRPVLAGGPPGFIVSSPYVQRDTERLFEQLKTLRPGLIIANKGWLPPGHPIVQWMAENYRTISPPPESVERFLFLIHQDLVPKESAPQESAPQ
ncbi:MAG: glycosyltransferase family 39 protein [Candidatus Contendobacter sp.]|nr:glycosyltransferase family 39 protein [Candidatus Contendobacter sp.]